MRSVMWNRFPIKLCLSVQFVKKKQKRH